MSTKIFKKIINDIKAFDTLPKTMIFAGHGEPLTHPGIAFMVKYAKTKNTAGRIEIVSNGSLLTQQLSDSLIDADLDRLRISLQGLDEEDYLRVCGKKIDFNEFLSQLEYFYHRKKEGDLLVKIIDIALKSPLDKERFHAIFDPICDKAQIEYLFPFIDSIDHQALGGIGQNTKHGGGKVRQADICAMPFYMLVVLPTGNVTGCCAVQPPVIFGNIMYESLYEIWNGKKRRNFIEQQINGRKSNNVCRSCTVPDYGMQEGDYLDEHRSRLCELWGGQSSVK